MTSEKYEPDLKIRISIVGALRNAADTLRELHEARKEDPDFDDIDYSGSEAFVLDEIADSLTKLDGNPALIFEWADLYALHGLAAAHFKPAPTPADPLTPTERFNGALPDSFAA